MGYSTGDKLKALWTITRPVDGIVMGIGLIVAMVLAGSIQLEIPLEFYILVFAGGFFVTSHAMVANDIIDIEIDKINEPDRVLPSGIISPKTAGLYAVILAAVGILFFVLVDLGGYDKLPYLWVYALFHVILADVYNKWLKETGFLGNIVVAESSYALFLAGDLFLNGGFTLIPQTVGIIAFCASLSREVYKGIIDQEGDAEHGVRTVAVVLGARRAKYIATAIFSICLIMLIFVFPQLNLIGQIGVVVVGSLFSYVLYLSKDAHLGKQSRKIKTYILIGPLIVSPFLILDKIFVISGM